MKPRPVHITKISGVELLPVGGDVLTFHLNLTDAEGRKMPFVLGLDALGNLLDQAGSAITLAMMPKGGITC